MKNVPGDLVSLTIVSSIADCAGTLISGLIYNKLGPKLSHILSATMAALGSVVLLFVWYSNSPRLILMCILVSKFGAAAVFNMVYVDFQVLTPTLLTSTMFGIVNAFARLFASASCVFAELDHVTSLEISISFSIIQVLVSFFLVTKLPKFIWALRKRIKIVNIENFLYNKLIDLELLWYCCKYKLNKLITKK